MGIKVQNVEVAVVGGTRGRLGLCPIVQEDAGSEPVVLGAKTERRVTKLSRKYDIECCLNYDEITTPWYPISNRWDSR